MGNSLCFFVHFLPNERGPMHPETTFRLTFLIFLNSRLVSSLSWKLHRSRTLPLAPTRKFIEEFRGDKSTVPYKIVPDC